jgi:iron complex outermembrane recepter protein
MQTNNVLGDGVPIFSLRGISMSDFSLSQNGPIATYYDEVYKGNVALLGLAFYDIERVEVLKGPQGTLYGKNTTGGAINLVSRAPDFSNEAYISLSAGNFNYWQAEGAGQLALSDTVAARVAFTWAEADGWMENEFAGAPDANSIDQYGLRASLRYAPSDRFDLVLRASTSLQNPWNYGVSSSPTEVGIGGTIYPFFGIPADFAEGIDRREINTPDVYRRRLRTDAVALTANWKVTDALTVVSISSWDEGSVLNHEDGDATPLEVSDAVYSGETRQFSQDLRLPSDFDGPANFILGVYYNRERISNSTTNWFSTDIDVNEDGQVDAQDCIDGGFFPTCGYGNEFDQDKDSFAVYSDLQYKITDRLTARAGLRYTKDSGDLNNFRAILTDLNGNPLFNIIPGSDDLGATTSRDFDDDDISGKIGLDYELAADMMVYASYSRGYRGASFNAQAIFSPAELTIADPETLDAVEVGFKSELAGASLRLNGAAFWYGYKDQQFIDIDPDTTIAALINLPESEIIGGELELQWLPVADLTLTSGLGLLKSEIKEGTSQGQDVSGNELVSAPELNFSLAIDWTLPLWTSNWELDAHADGTHVSRQYFDILNRPTTTQDGYEVFNARLRARPADDRYGISLWVKNITNSIYYTNMIDVAGLGFLYNHVSAPRTFGLTFDARF